METEHGELSPPQAAWFLYWVNPWHICQSKSASREKAVVSALCPLLGRNRTIPSEGSWWDMRGMDWRLMVNYCTQELTFETFWPRRPSFSTISSPSSVYLIFFLLGPTTPVLGSRRRPFSRRILYLCLVGWLVAGVVVESTCNDRTHPISLPAMSYMANGPTAIPKRSNAESMSAMPTPSEPPPYSESSSTDSVE